METVKRSVVATRHGKEGDIDIYIYIYIYIEREREREAERPSTKDL